MSGASGCDSTPSAISTARCTLPAFIAKVADSASSVRCDDAVPVRPRTFCRNVVARSGSESIQNWLAARGSAHAITCSSESDPTSTAASTESASRPRPCQARA